MVYNLLRQQQGENETTCIVLLRKYLVNQKVRKRGGLTSKRRMSIKNS